MLVIARTAASASLFALLSAASARAASAAEDERFVVDLSARTISVRHDGALSPLAGIEPILGGEEGERGRSAILEVLHAIPADEALRVEPDPRAARSGAVYVYRADGSLLNEALLREGVVHAVTTERYAKRQFFVYVERQAREDHAGLWRMFEATADAEPDLPRAKPPQFKKQVYRVWFATDRKATGSSAPNDFFGPDRGDIGNGLTYGSCEVSIPPDHRMGEMERPVHFILHFAEDPDRHVMITSLALAPKDAFFAGVAADAQDSADGAVLVFIHGYNVDFAEAARRTGQLAYDLSFDGVPILYSWPSRGATLDYISDISSADWSAQHLHDFLVDVARTTGVKTMHVIAHSMGNRALTAAMKSGFPTRADGTPIKFNEVVLTAPDIDAQMFREQIAPAIRGCADRITLYGSSADLALRASKEASHYPRAGDGGADVVVVDGIDTIDVSALDSSFLGHSYFGESTTVICDMHALLNGHKPPAQRDRLVGAMLGTLAYWKFVPN